MSTLTINANILNVRQTPSTDAPVVTQLPRDTQVEKVSASTDGEWFQVRTAAGTSGWIAAKYALEAAPAAAAAQAWVSINASLLNVRETPEPGGRVVAQLPRDTRVQKLGASADGQWVNVQLSTGGAGWVAAQYAVDSPAPSATPAPTAAPAAAPAPSGEEPKWLTIARGELGQAEIEGAQNNPRIVEYHQATSLHASDDETPWCSAFANWCMKQAGIKGTGEANARSWLGWGRALSEPVPGCITVLKRGNSTTSGHVAFYLGRSGDYLQILGGNQSNRVKISNYPKADLLGYRWPNL